MELAVFWFLCGIVAAMIGARKGQRVTGFLFGILLGPLGVLIMLFTRGTRKACIYCRELMQRDAKVCPHCQREQAEAAQPAMDIVSAAKAWELERDLQSGDGAADAARRNVPSSPPDDGDPDIETIVTARGGTLTYRVLAYRHLTQDEGAAAVVEALKAGRITEPPPGGEVVVQTEIR